MSRRIPAALAAAFALAHLGTAAAQDIERVTFDEAVRRAIERNPTVGEAAQAILRAEAVLSRAFVRLDQVPRQLDAVRAFAKLPEAPSLAAANKRIANILKQAGSVPAEFDPGLFSEAEERQLASAFAAVQPGFESAFKAGDYTGALRTLASLKAPVDAFFDKVLVMDKDERVRQNRIGFLGKLHATMNRVADLSRLAA